MKVNYWQSLEYDCKYHIYNRAIGKEIIFISTDDYLCFLDKFQEYCAPYFQIYAYCLIPNHFHFIIQINPEEVIIDTAKQEVTLSAQGLQNDRNKLNVFLVNQLRRLFSSYAIKFNNKYNRRGPLFSNKVKRVSIENNERLKFLIGYVHHNPIHHLLSNDYSDWRYSSYQSILSNKTTKVSRFQTLKLFNGMESFLEFHEALKNEKRIQ